MRNGINDYDESLRSRVLPATGLIRPPGPDNFPITKDSSQTPTELLKAMLQQMVYQNVSRRPNLRGQVIDDVGQTLDWSNIGLMDTVFIRNKGPNSVWIAFDISGQNVDAFTSDLSFELQAQESLSMGNCQFYKIGCKCAAGEDGTVHAIAFQAVAGDLAGSIS